MIQLAYVCNIQTLAYYICQICNRKVLFFFKCKKNAQVVCENDNSFSSKYRDKISIVQIIRHNHMFSWRALI